MLSPNILDESNHCKEGSICGDNYINFQHIMECAISDLLHLLLGTFLVEGLEFYHVGFCTKIIQLEDVMQDAVKGL